MAHFTIDVLSSLTLAEFKVFKVALRGLLRANVERETAVEILVAAILERRRQQDATRFLSNAK